MKSALILLIAFFSPPLIFAFHTSQYPYEWENNRSRFSITKDEEQSAELILKHHIENNFGFENDQFIMHSVIHRIILVNNSEAIQKHNRIFIPMKNTIELVELRARAINKLGKVILFDKSNLKEIKDEESGNAYRIFAIEGVELGSEIEYFFVRKMFSDIFDKAYMQMEVPVKHSSFVLRCPKHLKFDFKSYHGYADVTMETNETDNIYTASMADLPALKKEAFSYYDANRKRIEYKLAYNTAKSAARLYTWDDAAKSFYKILNNIEKDDEKYLDKFIKSLQDNPSSPFPIRIRNVEQQVKASIQINEASNDKNLAKISAILKYKVASQEGITKLMIQVFNRLNITTHIVVTCSRETAKFDQAFDSWNYLDNYVLYFPDTKGFLSPYTQETRYPLIPADYTSQKGLFIEPFSLGSVKSALGTVQEITPLSYDLNTDNLDITVDFSEDLLSNTISMKREFSGYNASYFTPYYHLMSDQQRFNMVEELTKQTVPGLAIKKWTAKPFTKEGVDQFIVDIDFTSSHFIEKAGPRILFKIGLLIGPQTEMYRDDKRVLEVENEYNRGYERIIRVGVPEGYFIKNANDLTFDVVYKDGEEIPFSFQSDYSIDGNVLTVNIKEYYKQIYAPLSRYEDYRKVINAAADFNKVTLVIERRK